ncbi:DMT family transporter [Fulvivirgaceae bacterium BMA10]|uniref:DMT family transporter n=1 Tax=Splendidivirga corallicola TaxID=3051826 RepID=A0ABT8L158_9BACT|nr:DMT family transporter [Fulvivirgaceae bacterium BMA10]
MKLSSGVRFMLFASFFFALMNVCVKLLPGIPAVEIIFFRSIISLVMSLTVLKYHHVSVWGNNPKILVARGFSGAIALILYFVTLQKIPLASAATIQYLAPIFTAVLGIFIVKEKVKPIQWLFFITSFIGTLMIQGFDIRFTFLYLIIGVISSFFSGLAYNIIRKLNTTEHPLVIVFYFPLVTLPITGIISFFFWVQPQGIKEWGLLIVIGVLTQFAQYFMTRAYQTEELSKVAILKYIGIIYALSFGFVLFDEHFNLGTYLGMVVVLLGAVLNIWYKGRNTVQKHPALK